MKVQFNLANLAEMHSREQMQSRELVLVSYPWLCAKSTRRETAFTSPLLLFMNLFQKHIYNLHKGVCHSYQSAKETF